MGGCGSASASRDRLGRGALVAALLLPSCLAPAQQEGRIGDLATEGGEVIRDCRVGYRTFGELDAARSNAVLLAPWFLGTSRDLAAKIGPGKLIDGSRFFVIAVDPLGNGVSSSPSNSPAQPGRSFPRFTIRDMVASQHALVARVLGIPHLRAVVGESMGGMQAFAWATDFPGFADEVVAIAGSPRTVERDRRRWRDAVADVRARPGWRRALGAFGRLEPRDALRQLRVDPLDHAGQAEAIMALDLTAPFGGSLARAAAAVRGRMLVVVSARDETVDPAPARELAGLARAELLVLDGRCGHEAARCEKRTLHAAVRRFLEGS